LGEFLGAYVVVRKKSSIEHNSNYGFYLQKTEKLFEQNRRMQRVEESKGDSKALSKVLNSLNLSDSEYVEFSFKSITSTGVVFLFCDLRGSDFSNSMLSNCDFTFANLQGCDFRDTILTNCIFRHSNLKEADFTGAKMLFCDFTGSNFHLLKKSL